MLDLYAASPNARVYLKPSGFLDSPQFFDEQNRRLANCLIWFSQVEVLCVDGEQKIRALIPVAEIEDVIQQMRDEVGERAWTLWRNLISPRDALSCGDRILRMDQPHVMGILNMTPDSFSDGGRFTQEKQVDVEAAADAGFAMATAGASIIDIGGESTRPGAETVWEGDEIARTVPIIERLSQCGAALSVDTRKAAVMEAALAAGAHIVNDISALGHDDRALDILAHADVPVCIMHAPSQGDNPHTGDGYSDVVTETFDWLERRIAELGDAGIAKSRIIADPGLGFGKSMADNTALINNIAMFHALGVPLLIGASRKRFIGALAKEAPVDQRLGGSLAMATHAIQQGALVVRVHDVPETVQAATVWRGLRDAGVTARV